MAQLPNVYGYTTPIGQAIAQAMSAFAANDIGPYERERQKQQIALYGAQADKLRSDAALNQQKLGAPGQLAGLFEQAYGPLGETPLPPGVQGPPMPNTRDEQVRAVLPQVAGTLGAAGEYGKIGDMFRALIANAPGTADDTVLRSVIGAGGAVDKGSAFSMQGQADLAARDQANEIAQIFAKPVDTAAGAVTTFGAGDPRGRQVYGPATEATAKGAILSRAPRDVQLSAVRGSVPAVSNYMLPDGSTVLSSDGMNDTYGNRLPPGAMKVGLNVNAADTGGLRPTTISGVQKSEIEGARMQSLLDSTRDLAGKSPSNFGFPGFVKGAMQDTSALLGGVAQTMGYGSEQEAVADVQAAAARAGISPELLPGIFDPDLPALQTTANLLIFTAASALAGQEGRSVSDKDVKLFRDIVGDPTSFFMSQQKFLAKLDTVENILNQRRDVNQRALKGGVEAIAPSGAPAASGAPAPGTVEDGYRFTGGDPADPANWQRVQ